ncbi:hypothetical protein HDV01_004632 [Terramyces sp. JEL0728]|nr:hypothetical protein HDV01_004632 [Terramyces sp. JEL0728]
MAANSFALYKNEKQQDIAKQLNLRNQAEIHQKVLELWVNEPLKVRLSYIDMSAHDLQDQTTQSSKINSEIYRSMESTLSVNVHTNASPSSIPQFPGSVSPDVLFATQLEEPDYFRIFDEIKCLEPASLQFHFSGF